MIGHASSVRLDVELRRHLQHSSPEAERLEKGVSVGVLPGAQQDHARGLALAEPRERRVDQGAGEPTPARAGIDVEVVQLAAGVEEIVPVAPLQRRVRVPEDAAVLLGQEDARVPSRELAREEPLVALLDRLDQHEARGIEPVVQAHQLGGEARDGGEVFSDGRTNRHGTLYTRVTGC
jgi:hypothetical protein